MEITDPNFDTLIAAPPQYRPPDLVDSELVELIAKRGVQQVNSYRRNTWLMLAVFLPIGFFAAIANCHLLLCLCFLVAVVGWAGAALKTATVSRAFKNHRYRQVVALLPSAMRWGASMYPFTVLQFVRCQHIQLQLLQSEARFIELELLSRFLWAVHERTPITAGTPKNWALANNLAISLMLQGKYGEAARLFQSKISSARNKNIRLVLLNNLAFCQAQDNQLDSADTTLDQAFKLLGSNTKFAVSSRLRYIRSLVQLERGEIEEAERSIDDAVAIGQKQHLSVDLQAGCTAVIARIRHKQGRLEESELHFHNAIDTLTAMDNPSYIGLADCLHYYAQLQYETGNIDGARKSLDKARSFYDHYVERETATITNIKDHLKNTKKPCTSITLLQLANREPLLEMQH